MRRALPALGLAALLAFPLPGRALPEEDPEAAWARGLRLEQALGDLDGALGAYRRAAAAGEPARRGAALLREAAVLRRLGKPAEAREVLEGLLREDALRGQGDARRDARAALDALGAGKGPDAAVADPEVARLRGEKEALEREVVRLGRSLGEALENRGDVEGLRSDLRARDRDLSALRARLREAEKAARGGGAESEAEREARRREEASHRAFVSAEYARYGRELYAAGRFEEARGFLREAVENDPQNLAARDLLLKASAPEGERQQMVREILDVIALEHELRADQVRAEATALLEEARDLLGRGRPGPAQERLDLALARLGAHPDLRERLAPVREQVADLFDRAATAAGSPRRAPPPPGPAPEDPRWQEAVRAVLEQAGSAGEAGGAALRIFSLAPLLRMQRETLPPAPAAGSPPRGFLFAADPPAPAGPLVAALRGAVEPSAWEAPGAVLESVGATLVARAGGKALDALGASLAALAEPPARSVGVRVVAFPCDPGALAAALGDRGVYPLPARVGAGAVAALDPAGAEAVLAALGGAEAASADALLRVPERRGFTLAALRPRAGAPPEEPAPGTQVEALAWFLPDGRIALGVSIEVAAEAAPGAAEALRAASLARQRVAAGAALPAGGALLVAGLADPARGGKGHLALLVRVGEAPAEGAAPAPAAGTRLALGDLASRAPDLPGPLSPRASGDPRAARAEAIRQWLERRGDAGPRVLLDGGGYRVEAGGAAAAAVGRDLERLAAAAAPVPLEVRAYALDATAERALLRDLRVEERLGEAVVGRVQGERRRTGRLLLEGGKSRFPLGDGAPAACVPGQRVPFARTEGTTAAGSARLAGVELGVRAWPGDADGETGLWVDLCLQRPGAESPAWWSLRTALPADATLLIVGIPNPFADAPARPRLALLLDAGGASPGR